MYRTIIAGILSLSSSFWMLVDSEGGKALDVVAVSTTTVPVTTTSTTIAPTPSVLDELIGHTIPDITYLFERGQCETGKNWRNGGSYSGFFGAYRGTWQQWGGYEDFGFYNASEGTREQQVLIWYRVHYLGYDSPTRGHVPSAGRLINNCSRYAEDQLNGEIPMITVDQDTVNLWRILIANTGRG